MSKSPQVIDPQFRFHALTIACAAFTNSGNNEAIRRVLNVIEDAVHGRRPNFTGAAYDLGGYATMFPQLCRTVSAPLVNVLRATEWLVRGEESIESIWLVLRYAAEKVGHEIPGVTDPALDETHYA